MNEFGYMNVAAASPYVHLANPEGNATEIAALMDMAEEGGFDLLVLPELSLTGATCGDLFLRPELISAARRALLELAGRSGDMITIVGLPFELQGRLYNCAAVLNRGRVAAVIPKHMLSSEERRRFHQGSMEVFDLGSEFGAVFGRVMVKSGGMMLGVEIGHEHEMPVPPSALMSQSGANVIAHLASYPARPLEEARREQTQSSQSLRLKAAIVQASAGQGESTGDAAYMGGCFISEHGDIMCRERSFAGASVDIGALEYMRKVDACFFGDVLSFPAIDMEPGSFVSPLLREVSATPYLVENEALRHQQMKDTLDIQAAGLIKRLAASGLKRVVLGVSGGLDSTLALAAAVRAFRQADLPMQDILCVIMPGFGTSTHTRGNAHRLCEALGVPFREIDITAACLRHFEDIGHDKNTLDITYENTQARERTQILMDIANREGALVLGTGDLSELALGFCTYGGDHLSMYSLNSAIPKTLIPYLLGHFARSEAGDVKQVLEDIANTPISPELLPPGEDGSISQLTEKNVGPYILHDFFLYHYICRGAGRAKLQMLAERAFVGQFESKEIARVLEIFYKRFFSQQFKRSCAADGVMAGSISLSPRGGYMVPSDAQWKL